MLKKFKKNNPIIIEPYRGYASPQIIYLRGRVLTDKGIETMPEESFLNKFVDNFNRFDSNEIPDFPLHLTFNSKSYQLKSDREGFFLLDVGGGPQLGKEERWETIDISTTKLLNNKSNLSNVASQGELLIPSSEASYGVISDIDDTILITDVSATTKAIRNTLFKNPYDREQLTGMSMWLQGFQETANPIFYVSKSPRNIFNYLSQFLSINQFPKGPILLRDFGRQGTVRPKGAPGHKKEEILRIMNAYPHLKFILIGDIAGNDPMIYHEIQLDYPERILAIYIRDINHKRKQKKFNKWLDKQSSPNLFVMKDSWEGARHAYDHGWITDEVLQKIQTKFQ